MVHAAIGKREDNSNGVGLGRVNLVHGAESPGPLKLCVLDARCRADDHRERCLL
jgi:hypothetical protein